MLMLVQGRPPRAPGRGSWRRARCAWAKTTSTATATATTKNSTRDRAHTRLSSRCLELVADVAGQPSLPGSTLDTVHGFLLLQFTTGRQAVRRRKRRGYGALFRRIAAPRSHRPRRRRAAAPEHRHQLHWHRCCRGSERVLVVEIGRVKSAKVVGRGRRLFGGVPARESRRRVVPGPAPAPEQPARRFPVPGHRPGS